MAFLFWIVYKIPQFSSEHFSKDNFKELHKKSTLKPLLKLFI